MKQAEIGQYAIASNDANGNWMDGGETYKLIQPPGIAQNNFLSMIIIKA